MNDHFITTSLVLEALGKYEWVEKKLAGEWLETASNDFATRCNPRYGTRANQIISIHEAHAGFPLSFEDGMNMMMIIMMISEFRWEF